MNFSRENLMKGLGQIVAFSVRDESLHSEGGCWLFRQLISEYPELWVDELKKDIYDAARLTVQLEDSFIDWVFSKGEMEGINSYDLKNYVRHRANTKLVDLGLKSNWKNVDKEAVSRITSWFDIMVAGTEHQDFFAQRVSAYGKAVINFDDAF
jgi:ribonucleoside-diphosphate reductase beta chain